LLEEKRKGHDQLFTKRSTEGYYEILINGHLKNNEIKFREPVVNHK
jgi:hypothetical protein